MIDIKRSKLKQDLLILFLSNKDSEFYMRQLERKIGHSVGNIRKDLKVLEQERLFTTRKESNRVYYKINKLFPYLDEITRDLVAYSKPKQILNSISDFEREIIAIYERPANKKLPPYDLIIVGDDSREFVENKILELKKWSGQSWSYTYLDQDDISYSIIKADQDTTLVWKKD